MLSIYALFYFSIKLYDSESTATIQAEHQKPKSSDFRMTVVLREKKERSGCYRWHSTPVKCFRSRNFLSCIGKCTETWWWIRDLCVFIPSDKGSEVNRLNGYFLSNKGHCTSTNIWLFAFRDFRYPLSIKSPVWNDWETRDEKRHTPPGRICRQSAWCSAHQFCLTPCRKKRAGFPFGFVQPLKKKEHPLYSSSHAAALFSCAQNPLHPSLWCIWALTSGTVRYISVYILYTHTHACLLSKGSWVVLFLAVPVIRLPNQHCCQAIFSVSYCTLGYLGLVTGTTRRKSETCVNVWRSSSQRISILLHAIVVFLVVAMHHLKKKKNKNQTFKWLPKVWNSSGSGLTDVWVWESEYRSIVGRSRGRTGTWRGKH